MKRQLFISGLAAIFLVAGVAAAQAPKIESVYTDLSEKSCKTLESNPEEGGWYRGECPGVGGYRLQITEGDIRQSIDVIAPNKKKFELDLTGNVSGAFSYVGAKAEWRVVWKDKIITPAALIVRFDASENPDDATKVTSYLVVAKITKSQICVTDVVKPSAKANEEARKLADSAQTKACKAVKN